MLPTNSSCFTKAVNYPHLSTFILMINSLSIPGSVCETPDYESKNKRRRLLIKVRSVIQLKYIYSIGYYFKFNNINNTNRMPKKDREIKLFFIFLLIVVIFTPNPYLWQQIDVVFQKKHIETIGRGITDTLYEVRRYGIFR